MTTVLEELEESVETELENYEYAEECVKDWEASEREFDGYMSAIVGMGLAYEAVDSDLLEFQAQRGTASHETIELSKTAYFEFYKIL